jgi:hypothetical protein
MMQGRIVVTAQRHRPISDARRDRPVFVAPLVAATLARFGAMTAGRPRTNPRGRCFFSAVPAFRAATAFLWRDQPSACDNALL